MSSRLLATEARNIDKAYGITQMNPSEPTLAAPGSATA
eukprot:CAMPEP_0174708116 /NCGR_PEP_ID=MMETSP1094-20130205/10455_1 /TAXON_ID=156173 /ORGANISM="Chrysochromulina brevifilum, Strain UTEX LB 985" /LENGTH=37 /DNA_ID= /DNA_START= /DNA_END= /DNA_ORIENTATION=